MLFSIAIVNYNGGKYLEQAICSILTQSCKDYEILLADGGSTDNSLNIINKYKDYFSWWISEKDEGQSDAFNKCFSHAKGDFYCWLNADDLMFPKALEYAKESINKYKSKKWFFGNTVYIDKNGNIEHFSKGCNFPYFLIKYGYVLPSGPSTFFHKSLFKEYGPFDINYHYTMDGDLWRKIVNGGVNYKMINNYCWVFRLHEESKTTGVFNGNVNPNVIKEESIQIIKNNYREKKICKFIQKIMRSVLCYPTIMLNKLMFKGCNLYETSLWVHRKYN